LWKTVHAFADFKEDASVDDKAGKGIGCNDDVGQEIFWDPHVLLALHGGVEVEVFCICAHEAGAGGRDGAIDEQLDCCDLGVRCGSDAEIVDQVATNGPVHAIGVGLLTAVCDDGAEISCCSAGW
jgi:hypothetical protein